MRELLRPSGRLAVIGCARIGSVADLPAEIGGFVLHRLDLVNKQFTEAMVPTCWPPPETYASMRRISQDVLPGARFQRRLLWRYSVIWTKPPSSAEGQVQAA